MQIKSISANSAIRAIAAFTAIVAIAPITAPAVAQEAAAGALDSARALVRELMRDQSIPGLAIAVGRDGDIVWSEGFGTADRARGRPVTSTTMFRIGSVSKPVTAAAVMRLVEEGKLDLDTPVQQYVVGFPEKRWVMTTRQLAGHLAGVRHYRGMEFLINRPFASVAEGLTIFRNDTLLFEPGTRYSYSSYGWNLISAVVEGASGGTFLAYLHDAVLAPLDMNHTAPDRNDSLIPERTAFYSRDPRSENGAIVEAPAVDNSYKWAGGGLLSTPDDLLRFAFAHLDPGFHRAETLSALFTSQRTRGGEETGYGIGWRTGTDRAGRRVWSHGGGSVGGTTALVIYPEARVVVAVVANLGRVRYGDLPARVAGLFAGW